MVTPLLLCGSILKFHALTISNSCTKDRCGFLFVRYKRHCCTELVSWEHATCPLSGIKKRPLVRVGGWLNTSSIVISFGATASVRYREVVRSWEGPLWEVPLYYSWDHFKSFSERGWVFDWDLLWWCETMGAHSFMTWLKMVPWVILCIVHIHHGNLSQL